MVEKKKLPVATYLDDHLLNHFPVQNEFYSMNFYYVGIPWNTPDQSSIDTNYN